MHDPLLPAEPAPTAPAPEAVPAPLPADTPLEAAQPSAPAAPEVVDAAPAQAAAEPATGQAAPAAPAGPPAELSPAATARRLAELFPALFAGGARPLKLRIQADIQQRAPGVFTRKSLSVFLHRHTTSTAYLRAVAQQPARLDLDGQPAGEIAEEHRAAAVAELERRRGIVQARREAEQRQQREAEGQARVAQAAERRERAALLRAFETTTLTRPNFCALKGLSEAQLDEQLALARQEAAERAQWLAGQAGQERSAGDPQAARPSRPPRPPGPAPDGGEHRPGREAGSPNPANARRRDRGRRPGPR